MLTKRDQTVKQTGFGGDVLPSQQYSAPPPPWPQVQMSPPPQPQPQPTTLMLTPAVPPTLTTSAGLVQLPSQNLVLQQAPPQVYLSTAPANPAPTMTLSTAPAPQPAGNLFLTAPTLATAPAPAATLSSGVPTAITANVAAAPTLAAGPPTPLAVSNQTLSIPTSGAKTRVRVRGPGLLASGLSRLGEKLTQLGRTRIETTQETTLEAPVVQPSGGGLTTISTTSMAPVAQPQTMMLSTPQPQLQQQPCLTPPPSLPPSGPMMPSPQAPPSKHWHD